MTPLNDPRKAAASEAHEAPLGLSCSAYGCVEGCISDKASSRRLFLQAAVGGTLAGLVTAGMEFATPRPVLAQSTLSPDAALQQLMDGNQRFTSGRLTAHGQDLA